MITTIALANTYITAHIYHFSFLYENIWNLLVVSIILNEKKQGPGLTKQGEMLTFVSYGVEGSPDSLNIKPMMWVSDSRILRWGSNQETQWEQVSSRTLMGHVFLVWGMELDEVMLEPSEKDKSGLRDGGYFVLREAARPFCESLDLSSHMAASPSVNLCSSFWMWNLYYFFFLS